LITLFYFDNIYFEIDIKNCIPLLFFDLTHYNVHVCCFLFFFVIRFVNHTGTYPFVIIFLIFTFIYHQIIKSIVILDRTSKKPWFYWLLLVQKAWSDWCIFTEPCNPIGWLQIQVLFLYCSASYSSRCTRHILYMPI